MSGKRIPINNREKEQVLMIKKSCKIFLVVMFITLIIICGDDETRDFLKRKLNKTT